MSVVAAESLSDVQLLGEGTASFVYRDRHFRCEAVKVLPGEYFTTGSDLMLVTLLGSCVSACIRDRRRGIGGMNHFLLPHDHGTDARVGARFGVYAMEVLINGLLHQGAQRADLEAKVFGGANVVRSMKNSTVGSDNARFVLQFLRREGIRIEAEELGGAQPRRVHYFPASGRALVRLLGNQETAQISRAEAALEQSAAQTRGEVALF